MTIHEWLKIAEKQLETAGIASARLDALVLLSDSFNKDKAHVLAHPQKNLTQKQQKTLTNQLKKRQNHIPLSYIRGKTEFYGREFCIDKRVLEPRPESETMVDIVKSLKLKAESTIVDVGTGSGALAITTKLEMPKLKVIATDIDKKCLTVARKNAHMYKVDIQFLQGNLLKPLSIINYPLSAILANLPYVPESWHINEAAAYEPRTAIFGGKDGLSIYRNLFKQINALGNKPPYVLAESLPPQHKKLVKIASSAGYQLQKTDDFIQLYRLI